MDLGLLYKALEQRQVSMVAGNATDGQLSVLDAVVLQDDQHYFPPYDCGLVVRATALLKDHPELAAGPRRTGRAVYRPDYAQAELSGGRRTSPRAGSGRAVLTGSQSASLVGNQQIFGKGPLRIDPLRFTEESRPLSETGNLLDAELVAGFRPDRFPFFNSKGEVCGPNRYGLGPVVERRCISIRRSLS